MRRAIELCADDLAQPALLARLRALLGDSLLALGQHEAAGEAFAAALGEVRPDKLLLRVTLQRKVAQYLAARHHVTRAERALDLALETMGPFSDEWPRPWQRAWLETQLVHLEILYFRGDLERLAEVAAIVEQVVEAVGTVTHGVDFLVRVADMAA